MINKKAEEFSLLSNLASVMVAVIATLLILGLGGWIVYKYITIGNSPDEENAKATLESIDAKINSLEEGENSSFIERRLEGNWKLMAWNADTEDSLRPQKCFLKNCLCLFPASEDTLESEMAEQCQGKNGIVRFYKNQIQTQTEKTIRQAMVEGNTNRETTTYESTQVTIKGIFIGGQGTGKGSVVQIIAQKREGKIVLIADEKG